MPRSMLVTLFALALAACNTGQPRVYRIALDTGPLKTIDRTCYRNDTVPTSSTSESTSNLLTEQQWVIWDGAAEDGTPLQFLDFGKQAYKLGDSPAVDIDELVRTAISGTFKAARLNSTSTAQGNGTVVQVRTGTLTTSFSNLGTAPTGKLLIEAKYECTTLNGGTCPNLIDVTDAKACSASLPFSARRIEVSRIAPYTEEGK